MRSACGRPGVSAHCSMNALPPDRPATSSESERLLSLTLVVGLFGALFALVLFSWLARGVLSGITPDLDEQLRASVHALASPTLTQIMIAASRYGGPSWLSPIGVGLALVFLLRGWHRGALLVVVTLSGAGLLDWVLKDSFARARPGAFFDYPLPLSHSFPSGHALFGASFFGGVAVLLWGRLRSGPVRVLVWLVCLAIILLIGVSRVYLGVHYPSDVVAGYSAAVVWVAAVALGDRIASRRRSVPR
jgi:undecaprenyl-diphosphatase